MTRPARYDATDLDRTVVHLLRHGEVHNPERILYGRLPDYHLSDRGRRMSEFAAGRLADRDIALLVSSPLERALETAAPLATATGLTPLIDARVIEAGNHFEGERSEPRSLLQPRHWWLLRNPAEPSWGEPYAHIAARMQEAVFAARDHVRGREAVIVTHQLPIWVMRLKVEGRPFIHDPRRRQCNLASFTSLTYLGDRLASVTYAEPAAQLYSHADTVAGA
ncbi:histidine phosphatase family protein [Kribbia dieselivorans]|uniref:histidine phosphatase family protein n=1 Tax=Kribbia dieselivorans TaxID=331526 RepID=UPI00083891F7|nr:histidine phosphatase family protein [Kribbia dieselivorans]